ncbi:MAG: YncE family protein, partial [Candidatus Methylacidiphilaceae bacterium]
MWRRCKLRSLGWVMAVLLVRLTDVGAAEDLPTGQRIEPRAARGAAWQDLSLAEEGPHSQRAGQAVSLALSPDGRTLLVLTSGYNLFFDEQGKPIPDASQEHVFLFDVSRGSPHRLQTVPLPNSFCGIAWSPEGKNFYVSGGGDDSVHAYAKARSGWREVRPPLRLDHLAGNGLMTQPVAAGVAIDPDGKRLLVANWANDSVSLVDLGGWRRSVELDLRPGKISADSAGIPGGEYPFWVAWCGRGRAYVSSVRDRELVVLDVGESSLKVRGRIPLHGQPNRILAVPERSRAYVACDNSDTVVVLDTEQDRILEEIDVLAPVGMRPAQTGKGANPNGLALTPDGRMLLVSCGGTNAIAVLRLGSLSQGKKEGEPASELLGLIPTGWYPSSVAVGRDGGWLYVCNAKSPAGPNAEGWHPPRSLGAKPLGASERARNQYVWQRTLAGLLSLPLPDEEELRRLTRIVAENNGWRSSSPDSSSPGVLFSTLRRQIHHVIYVVKENRTYDQLLGDLGKGNGDPSLAILAPYSPNHQQIARRFVLLDNFYDSGEVSGDGWQWSTAAR